ncbi:ELL-associated factor 1-like [Stylophora pistillata]|uniref:Ell-associated factor Eaf n=1 Tax=Stylophora pistillata TaxID=50429 RepID=A0A2B4S5K4_STYPI|nr:ELL-associated factor 1-like [Stylophora pistillata]PFX24323.1 Ell-associated factor Eaf [Stylophora pistillata]
MAVQPSENEPEFPFNTSREFELRLGSSFHSKGGPKTAFHTIRYDFKPASVDTTRPAELVVGDKNEITVTVPNVQDSGNTVYRGSKRSCTKEFILVVDKEKKTFTLERIESTVPQLKKVRSSNQSNKPVKLPVTPSNLTLAKTQKNKTKNKKRPVEQKTIKQSVSPSKNSSTPAPSSSQEVNTITEDVPPPAETESGSSSSSDSSDVEKDENEDDDEFDDKDVEKLNSLFTNMDEKEFVTKKEGFNTLCEDLQLSESGSDSD